MKESKLPNELQSKSVIEKYRNQVIEVLNLRFKNDKSKLEKAINILDDEIQKSFLDPEEKFENDFILTYDETQNRMVPTSGLMKLSKFVDKYNSPKTKPIPSGFGVLYRQQDKANYSNETLKMVEGILKMRKKVKKEMFEAMVKANKYKAGGNEEKFREYHMIELSKNLQQLIYKLLANSIFGAMGESNSIFFNHDNAASITYTGVQLITTAVLAFEGFLANNIKFKDLDDFYLFVSNVLKEETKFKSKDIININISKDELVDYFFNLFDHRFYKEEYLEEIESVLTGLNQDQMNRLYYKRNFINFLKNDYLINLLAECLMVNMDNFNVLPEEIKDQVNELWALFDEFVAYYFSYSDRYERAVFDKRQSVLTVDTDSNFISLKSFYDFIYENYEIDNNDSQKISIINLMIYILSEYIAKIFWKFTDNLNIPDEKKEIINMKSEYLYSRIMLTSNKKQYAGNLLAREGNIIEGGKLDMKGLSIKKVTVNNRVREFFVEIIENDILKSDEIQLSKILTKFEELKAEIRESLNKGETIFGIPSSVNAMEAYVEPYQIQAVRGTILWNNLYPNDSIQTPSSILTFKIKVQKYEDLAPLYEDHDSEEYQIYQTIVDTIKSINTNAEKRTKRKIVTDSSPMGYGFKVIALPRNAERIPKWLIQFIDIEQMINDNISNGLIIEKSLGLNTEKIKNYEYLSNIINF